MQQFAITFTSTVNYAAGDSAIDPDHAWKCRYAHPASPDNPMLMDFVDRPGVNSGACTLIELTHMGAYQDDDGLWNYSVVANVLASVTEIYPNTDFRIIFDTTDVD